MVDAWGGRTHVTPPKSKLNVLRADVTLPFVFRCECRTAIVLGKTTWEWTCIRACRSNLSRARRRGDRFRRFGIRRLWLVQRLVRLHYLDFDRSTRLRLRFCYGWCRACDGFGRFVVLVLLFRWLRLPSSLTTHIVSEICQTTLDYLSTAFPPGKRNTTK